MKILVTGGAGFIGSHIVDRYIADGHDVVVIDNLVSGRKEQVNEKATFYQADILDTRIAEILRKEKPDVLNHHAAQIDVRKSVADPAFDAKVNIIGFLHLVEIGKKEGIRRVIFASSGGAIYPDAETFPTAEDHSPRPQSPYGITKLMTEYYLQFYYQTYDIPFVALRYGNVYGPRQDPHGEAGVVSIFIGNILEKKQPTIFGDGEQVRDYVFVDDVVDANIAALTKGAGIMNIGTGVGTSVNTLWQKIKTLMGSSLEEQHAPPRAGEAQKSILSPARAGEELSWRPKTSFDAGLRQTITFFQRRQT